MSGLLGLGGNSLDEIVQLLLCHHRRILCSEVHAARVHPRDHIADFGFGYGWPVGVRREDLIGIFGRVAIRAVPY